MFFLSGLKWWVFGDSCLPSYPVLERSSTAGAWSHQHGRALLRAASGALRKTRCACGTVKVRIGSIRQRERIRGFTVPQAKRFSFLAESADAERVFRRSAP